MTSSIETIAGMKVIRLIGKGGMSELQSAVEHVLTKTALSARDREIYREYAQKGLPIGEVAGRYGVSRNSVSQIKTRIERRIVAFGRELAERENSL